MPTPEIKIIPTPYQEVLGLLHSEPLKRVEKAIAAAVKLKIIEDYSFACTSSTQETMSVSGMTPQQIETLLKEHGDRIIRFGIRCQLNDAATAKDDDYDDDEEEDLPDQPEVLGLGTGFGILHAIDYNFLANRTPAEFLAFLKNRRTPQAARVAKELRQLFAAFRANG